MENDLKTVNLASEDERTRRERFVKEVFRNCPIPEHELLHHLALFMNGQALSRLLFMDELYRKALPIHGSILEFGVRWGTNTALWTNFRSFYEPYNYQRKIISFDTWAGFPSVHEKDMDLAPVGGFATTENYDQFLEQVLEFHEAENPVPHIKKHELRKGDASVELEKYLAENPHTIVSMAYFDFDIYEPTKRCLEMIMPHVTKGTVIGFDELNRYNFPGETLALKEVLGLSKYQITRSPHSRLNSYIVID